MHFSTDFSSQEGFCLESNQQFVQSNGNEPVSHHLLFTLRKIWQAIGRINDSTSQLGNCTLISFNLAITPYHCIADVDVRNLTAVFRNVFYQGKELPGQSSKVLGIVECDPILDYAIIHLDGLPGKMLSVLPICDGSAFTPTPIFLHYPIGKSLKVSFYKMEVEQRVGAITNRLFTREIKYRSSGGAYINLEGAFVAMHLGVERERTHLDLQSVAISIEAIMKVHPEGILSSFAKNELEQNAVTLPLNPQYVYELDFCPLSYMHAEFFSHKNFEDGNYVLRRPAIRVPGIVIEKAQSKYTHCWPGEEKETSLLRWFNLDDVVELAQAIVKCQIPLRISHRRDIPYIHVQINPLDIILSNNLSKKLREADYINLLATFDEKSKYWSIHFYPNK
ncbi:trypsin-like peptidase domain-containing protein [Parachlamydia acanthamoebae]|uniref:trypsin-like peptidase domain-containing protein n=1 Tax=Parachlamydia acanthamoebae TaxID=83552 RepID=UPI0024E26E3C|nr:trypsin-like peptidase domain-containing protein [Parachlamydia acanthamoebae]